MEEHIYIRQIVAKEIEQGCYDAKIDGISLYSLERDDFRLAQLGRMGYCVMDNHQDLNKTAAISSAIKSCLQVAKLFIVRKKCSTIIFPFSRVDKINGIYVDKFTDPVIDISETLDEDCILLDHGRGGVHPRPRAHQDKIVYIDILHIIADLKGRLFYRSFVKKHKNEFNKQKETIIKAFGEEAYSSTIERKMVIAIYYVRLLKRLFKLLKPDRVMQPARVCAPLAAAHSLGIKTYEFQHGITYGESTLYSGYQDEMVVPDYFLAFGDNKPLDVYGVEEKRIVNVGWAFWQYLENNMVVNQYGKDDVLVISDPEITDVILRNVEKLSKEFPKSNFYVRPHPHEVLSQSQLDTIEKLSNVYLQDKSINIMEVMMGFENIVGENSTVLYEALSMNKKVGKLFFEGLHPLYLEESDRNSFWEIKDTESFAVYLKGDKNSKTVKSIYSSFNKALFEETVFGLA